MQRREAAAEAAAIAAAGPEAAAAAREKDKRGGKKKKDKGSFSENFEVLKSSAKIRNLALLVMGYGVAHRCEVHSRQPAGLFWFRSGLCEACSSVRRALHLQRAPATASRTGAKFTVGSRQLFFGLFQHAVCSMPGTGTPHGRPCQGTTPIRRQPADSAGPSFLCRLFEFAWKGQLRILHPTVQGYQSVLADVSTYTGEWGALVCCSTGRKGLGGTMVCTPRCRAT